ncbi:hypothetical protein BC792_11648 [Sphingobacterium allocomposti]|jgi:hypothetical protein|uniref:Uncharacterized protein n=1 Tax=Sphingobacterium allocomposti TaxID=415956 RepID=A0A5S5DBD0_9SPHI|nr:hypothetical protein [Sphingobacterium composti Yoo et al. 2007 non Ten et al. 2007]TYP92446.1 hypothetical protein BC792_11648 [Sphingobacterium composti Yoo et al. 2007 non Ten et al. 2007]HLS95936.1 hypothetical protein [Sphingobacterium sp.]
MKRRASLIQGYYYLLTGIWPLLHMPSFMQVTGGKHDIWLVKMVGLLSISIGLALIIKRYSFLGFCAALSFIGIDLHYTANGTISNAYLVDAVLQLAFVGALIWEAYRRFTFLVNRRANKRRRPVTDNIIPGISKPMEHANC